jgi:hypothetical protein
VGITAALKFADTVVFPLIVTLQAPVPLQAPDQPANVEADPGASVRVTTVPAANMYWHVVPQLMPAGLLLTEPAPVPELCTVS